MSIRFKGLFANDRRLGYTKRLEQKDTKISTTSEASGVKSGMDDQPCQEWSAEYKIQGLVLHTNFKST